MRGSWLVAACLISGVLVYPFCGFSEPAQDVSPHLQLISNRDTDVLSRDADVEPRSQVSDRLPPLKSLDIPALDDVGISLDSTDITKHNELDSVTLKPWTPGRGAVGVKLEVTW